jgi:hypothetical protein
MASRNESHLEDIPNGSYCYTIKEIIGIKIKINLCPYYQYLDDGICQCSLTKIRSDEDFLFDDQVKVCNINELDF